MNGFVSTYDITRNRMFQCFEGLSPKQLAWRPHSKALSIFEMFMHLAGSDMFFVLRLQEREGSEYETKLEKCARAKVINDEPFPFSDAEASEATLKEALDHTYTLVYPMLQDCEAWAEKKVETVLGPVADAAGVFARICFHPAYHTGQTWLYRNHPDFPKD